MRLPSDCLLLVLGFLDAPALCLAAAVARGWRPAARSPVVWEDLHRRVWDTPALAPGAATHLASFEERLGALRRLPGLLRDWGEGAAEYRRADYAQRDERLRRCRGSVKTLTLAAPLVRRWVALIAEWDPAVCPVPLQTGTGGTLALPHTAAVPLTPPQAEAVHTAARHALWILQQEDLLGAWGALLDSPAIPTLEAGATLIARVQHPDLQMEEVDARLQTIADGVNSRLAEDEAPRTAAAVLPHLNHVLYADLGFQGNDGDYYSPANSCLNDVLRTRRGIPVTLCVVYAAVARRCGLVLEGVNAPCHFLLALPSAPGDPPLYIDAFRGGRVLTMEDVGDLVGGHSGGWGFRQGTLPVADPLLVFLRMLRNLINVFQHRHDTQRLMLCVAQMALLMRHVGDPEAADRYRPVLEEYRAVGTARILNP